MGLPSYVINFDELVEPIKQAFEEADIKLNLEEIQLSDSSIDVNTDDIEGKLDEIVGILENIGKNTESTRLTAEDIYNQMVKHDEELKVQLDDFQFKIQAMIDTLLDIHDLLEKISGGQTTEGRQKMLGDSIEIEKTPQITSREFVFEKDILLTGVTLSQSAWNNNDRWSLDIGGYNIFEDMYTKMRGEHKQLSKFYPIPAGTVILFNYDNTASANSKWVWFDLEFIELLEDGNIVVPQEPAPPVKEDDIYIDNKNLPCKINVKLNYETRDLPSKIGVKTETPLPSGDGRVHFSGVLIGGSDMVEDKDITLIWKEDKYSEILPTGEYSNAMAFLPKTYSSTFDAIAIDSGTRLEAWTKINFLGDKIIDIVGPAILSNKLMMENNDKLGLDVLGDSFYNSPYAEEFPEEVRYTMDMSELSDNFSFRISGTNSES
jgi:hypothetical protein